MKKKILIIVLAIMVCVTLASCAKPKPPADVPPAILTNAELYDIAVRDAMTVEDEELMPLIALTQDSPMANFNSKGQVLLLSWHKYPDSYISGQPATNQWGEVWTFTDKEILLWYDTQNGVTDWETRLEQLIGLPEDANYTHFSAFWVSLDDVIRPAYITDITKPMQPTFQEPINYEYKEWFDGNTIWSYFDSAYPWTRLGYTYDWADNGTEYGLSEFLILQNSSLQVEFTKTTDEFVSWLGAN